MTKFELKQEKERLEADLNGRKTYWYKEEVQRDHKELNKINKELKELNNES